MARSCARSAILASVLLACGAHAEEPGEPDLSLRLRPEARLVSAEAPTPRRALPAAPAGRPQAGPAHTFSIAPDLLADTERDLPFLNPARRPRTDLTLSTGRSTTFIDGGFGDAGLTTDETARRERAAGYAGSNAEFDVYDLSLRKDALSRGPLTLSLIGGVRAINVQASRFVDDSGSHASARTIVPVPVIGTGLRLNVTEYLHLSGSASTHTIPDHATLLDFTAQTGLRLRPNMTLYAGYKSVRSSVEFDSFAADLDQEGVFARLKINF